MSKLNRRDAMKAAATGLFLSGVVTKEGPMVAVPLFYGAAEASGPTLPVMTGLSTEVCIVIPATRCRPSWELMHKCVGVLSTDSFFGCEPGTLAGTSLAWLLVKGVYQITWELSSGVWLPPRVTTPLWPLLCDLTRHSQGEFKWSVAQGGYTRYGTGAPCP